MTNITFSVAGIVSEIYRETIVSPILMKKCPFYYGRLLVSRSRNDFCAITGAVHVATLTEAAGHTLPRWLIGIRDFVCLDSQRQVNTGDCNCPLEGKDRSAPSSPSAIFFPSLFDLLSFLLCFLLLCFCFSPSLCDGRTQKGNEARKGETERVVLLVIGASDASTNQSKRK